MTTPAKSGFEDLDFDPKDDNRKPDASHYDGKSRNSLDSTPAHDEKATHGDESWLGDSVDDSGQSGGPSTLGTQLDVNDNG